MTVQAGRVADAPDFMIIGAAKSGTTALFQYLEQHPDVFVSTPKEPHYFALRGKRPEFAGPGDDKTINRFAVTDPDAYRRLFAPAASHALRGEASVSYLYYPTAADAIRSELPDTKLICLLRNPVDRAFSAYNFLRTRDFEPLDSFEAALAAEPERIARNWHHMWHYASMGRYAEQLERWLALFPREQIMVRTYDDFRAAPLEVVRDTHRFLGLDERHRPSNTPSPHISGVPRSRLVSRVVTRPNRVKAQVKKLLPGESAQRIKRAIVSRNIERATLDPDVRARLVDHFAGDIARLERLVDIDLSAWTSTAAGGRAT